MMSGPLLFLAPVLLAGGLGLPESPPDSAAALIAAIEAGDLASAHATLADDASVLDTRALGAARSSLEALIAYIRGCERTDIAWRVDDRDPSAGTVDLVYRCPSGATALVHIGATEAEVYRIQLGPMPTIAPVGPSPTPPR
jgi:hypothetical protein